MRPPCTDAPQAHPPRPSVPRIDFDSPALSGHLSCTTARRPPEPRYLPSTAFPGHDRAVCPRARLGAHPSARPSTCPCLSLPGFRCGTAFRRRPPVPPLPQAFAARERAPSQRL